jgi:hypothetical protein
MNVLDTLLMIGYLTTPPAVVGVSLSEYWAWVRYLHAISQNGKLELSKEFASLDAHQKTILSDDFGMGFSMQWLQTKLDLHPACDGRYFIDFVAAAVGASSKRVSKRGPSKSPDFVALDTAGRWHIIECKGTQSGEGYRKTQFGHPGLGRGVAATGAIAQKHTISFPPNVAGQRLACGLSIALEDSGEASSLLIVDPDGDEEFAVGEQSLIYAKDAVLRSSTARALRLSGFIASSSIIAAPRGLTVGSRPTTGIAEERRREAIDQKLNSARVELENSTLRSIDTLHGENMRGREATIDLPKSILVGSREVRSVKVRQSFNSRILADLIGTSLGETPLSQIDGPLVEELDRLKVVSDDRHARLQLGNIFVSELELIST